MSVKVTVITSRPLRIPVSIQRASWREFLTY